MAKRILDIVDMQNDFMRPEGALYVPGADKIIEPANRFLKSLGPEDFDLLLLKYDTHFEETYALNPESKQFPPHCIYDSWGWKLAISLPKILPRIMSCFEMNKNVFDMWAAQPDLPQASFKNDFNRTAYNRLFQAAGIPRDRFMAERKIGRDTEVVIMGVASDYCVHDAIAGYLKRGCKVTVLSDLVRGIGTDVPGRAKSGDIHDVVKLDCFKDDVARGQLRVITSAQFKSELKKEKCNVTRKSGHRRRPDQPRGR